MSVSSLFGCAVATAPLSVEKGSIRIERRIGSGGLLIECSSRPQKKGTAHHMKTRPRKSQPWDIKRKPTVHPELPPLPPDWTVVIPAAADASSIAP